MIVKRMEIWDGNKTPTSRLPMFLVSENHEAIRWVQKKYLTTPKDSGETVETYDGYLKEYLMKKNTPNDCYILGVFVAKYLSIFIIILKISLCAGLFFCVTLLLLVLFIFENLFVFVDNNVLFALILSSLAFISI